MLTATASKHMGKLFYICYITTRDSRGVETLIPYGTKTSSAENLSLSAFLFCYVENMVKFLQLNSMKQFSKML